MTLTGRLFSPLCAAIFLAVPVFAMEVPLEHTHIYVVQKGENLERIAKKNHLTPELLRHVNALPDDAIKVGQKLKIPAYKFSVVVDKSQNKLFLKGDEEVLKTYTVATGANNSTPPGVFKVTDKLVNPTWYKPGGGALAAGASGNLLGTRWIGLDKKGYGIHGTTEPEKLGQQITAGCVRMRNDEVEELYNFVTPGTEVTIVN